ncbi:response regulator transcription factor [Marinospirillum sp.]|uniref:response regulator transcription factor n=1 Tax=Marinospirillum sp. TaxID=2183934 RepID=UPI003A8952AE
MKTEDLRVLVVDDEPMVCELLSELLKDQGYQVIGQASHGGSAIEKVKQYQPDIVCLDINMPEVSGLDALASIKTIRASTIVIMVTAVSQASEVQQAIRTGADGYLLKPFTGLQLKSAILKAYQRRQSPERVAPTS